MQSSFLGFVFFLFFHSRRVLIKRFGLDENHNTFTGKLFKGEFVTFLVLVGLGFS